MLLQVILQAQPIENHVSPDSWLAAAYETVVFVRPRSLAALLLGG